jgi:hypothetical protein
METEAQRRANLKYKKKIIRPALNLFPNKDADIIRQLQIKKSNGEGNAPYIKRLIREDIERQKPT